MSSGPLRVSSTEEFAELMGCPAALLDVTMDQLRTLLAVREAGSPLQAARLLEREHSSVRKQLDTLNRTFQTICGETVVVKQGRGQDYLFTPTGDAVIEIARRIFSDWLTGIADRRRQLGAKITVATTEFTIDFLSQIWPSIEPEFTRREIELNIVHVRTRDFWSQLDAKDVDLVCGSIPIGPDSTVLLESYDVIEWHREDLALLTNLPKRELAIQTATQERLRRIPLLAPSAGLIAEFLRTWYGPDYRRQLNIVAEVDSIYYGLALLRSQLVHGAMLSTEAAVQAAIEGRLPGGPNLRSIRLDPGFQPQQQVLAAIFARKNERENYEPTHPLNLLWNAFNGAVPG
jgi:DNA-binding transcriptional LysR family regulator